MTFGSCDGLIVSFSGMAMSLAGVAVFGAVICTAELSILSVNFGCELGYLRQLKREQQRLMLIQGQHSISSISVAKQHEVLGQHSSVISLRQQQIQMQMPRTTMTTPMINKTGVPLPELDGLSVGDELRFA